MSPLALSLAVLLHGLLVLALWLMPANRTTLSPAEVPIEVTVEQPKSEPPPAPPKEAPKPAPQPAPQIQPGLRPPGEITADKPTQIYSTPERPVEARPPHPDATLEKSVPPAQPEPPPPPPIAEVEPPKFALPPMLPQELGTLAPPAKTAPPPQQPSEIRPSPLSRVPQQRPTVTSRTEEPAPSPFINPRDTYNRARVSDNYLWQVVRKLSGYRYEANVRVSEGTTVIRIVIARDGRLLDIQVAQSSGYPELDRGVVDGVRSGSPYAPLPPEIQGDRATFTLPLVSSHRR
jgi:TonB family protein